MNRIDALLAELCPIGVSFKPIGEFCTIVRGNGMPKADFVDVGVGCIHYGQIYTIYDTWTTTTRSFIPPEKAKRLAKVDHGDVIVTNTSENVEDVCKAVAWLGESQIVTGGHATVLKHREDPKYLAYYLQTPRFFDEKVRYATGTKVIDVSAKNLARIRIPVPPLEVQQEIVKVLDSFRKLEAELEAELDAELEARRFQYRYYRDSLTSLANAAAAGKQAGLVEGSTLGESFAMRAGQYIRASEIAPNASSTHPYPCFGANGLRGFVRDYSHDGLHVLIGRQGALCGNVQRVSGKFYATEHAVVTTAHSGRIDMNWAFHKLTAMNLSQYATKSAQPGLAVSRLTSVEIQIPSFDRQARAATILDQCDALVSELSIGLLAELQARRRQYQYYRDQLLTFSEAA